MTRSGCPNEGVEVEVGVGGGTGAGDGSELGSSVGVAVGVGIGPGGCAGFRMGEVGEVVFSGA